MTTEPESAGAERLIARALGGERDALAAAVRRPQAAVRHGVAAALDRLARTAGIASPDLWRRQRRALAARWMLLEETRAAAARALRPAGVPWLVIKGCDLADRVYDAPEDRPSSDLDLLVSEAGFATARAALETAGWSSLTPGAAAERYRAEEGYAWQARREGLALVELHFRLWGLAPDGLGEWLVEDGVADAGLAVDRVPPVDDPGDEGPPGDGPGDRSPSVRRPSLAGAYLLAAVHLWLDPPPRPLRAFWDLERIAARAAVDGVDLARRVVELADRFDLQLPVALAAGRAAALWPRATSREIANDLLARLRFAERWLAVFAVRRGSGAPRLGSLVLARLLAGRRSRAGWRVVPRQLWAHPGVVAQETPGGWPWPRRRLTHLARQLGVGRR